jgi:hypothetical protein
MNLPFKDHKLNYEVFLILWRAIRFFILNSSLSALSLPWSEFFLTVPAVAIFYISWLSSKQNPQITLGGLKGRWLDQGGTGSSSIGRDSTVVVGVGGVTVDDYISLPLNYRILSFRR